jgi:hypothetical protein
MRLWSRRVKYEDRNRALGLCTRSKRHARRDPRSKNLCAACLKSAREAAREYRRGLIVPQTLKPARAQLYIASRVPDVPMPQVRLNQAKVRPTFGQVIAA